ncbi:chromate transport protein ChrA [Sphingobium sp. JAI105]|uniref:hypothetical protein n=1 Tax=Sphingobium sp. JAI105 TaxID=2787715 RepID=UPI0018CA6505|nr:hypothetical protein [Sphingobium sp. JAI105]MBG6116803.1 chromate transport protein ChrA [Sphingobium sp. JAI105]
MNLMEHSGVKLAADGLSIGVLAGTLSNALPSIAALMTIVWTTIRIWETATVQRWFGRKD